MDGIEIVSSDHPGAAGRRTLSVSGEITIAQASAFKDALVAALAGAEELHLDIRAAEVDLTGLQLICAAHKSAGRSDKSFTVADGSSGVLKAVADAAGFKRHVGCCQDCTHDCIWS